MLVCDLFALFKELLSMRTHAWRLARHLPWNVSGRASSPQRLRTSRPEGGRGCWCCLARRLLGSLTAPLASREAAVQVVLSGPTEVVHSDFTVQFVWDEPLSTQLRRADVKVTWHLDSCAQMSRSHWSLVHCPCAAPTANPSTVHGPRCEAHRNRNVKHRQAGPALACAFGRSQRRVHRERSGARSPHVQVVRMVGDGVTTAPRAGGIFRTCLVGDDGREVHARWS